MSVILSAKRNSVAGKPSRSGVTDEAGGVRWYKFGSPDKKRPVVILTRDSILNYLGEVTVAPVTSTVREIPSEICLSKHAVSVTIVLLILSICKQSPDQKLGR
ncbi:MAG: type II toxin-antitoxin system PemK/MazF family toxin [bacterium]|nr:type II toxin-antitoxin system PemK/MazF family toxin [bacterium]